MRALTKWLVVGVVISTGVAHAEDPVFSGPQVGEKLPPLKVSGVLGKNAEKDFDMVEKAGKAPTLLIFFNKRTRPAFGMTTALMKYAKMREKDGVRSGVVMLSEDQTASRNWLKNVSKYFPEGTELALAKSAEGPGAYGLNRNVTLTILVAKDRKVTANFALVQPSLATDGPKVLEALTKIAGGKAPKIEQLSNRRMKRDSKLATLVRPVISKDADKTAVKKAAERVEKYVAENENARKELGAIARRIVRSGKLSNYGTEPAQEIIKQWAKKYGASAQPRRGGDRGSKKKSENGNSASGK